MSGIYIHIPFCKQACHYCDFHFSTSLKKKEEMVLALAKEIELRKDEFKNETVETIYFGGGTPSILPIEDLKLLINTVFSNYKVVENPEITVEANPDDLLEERIIVLSKTKVNRLSIGIQSFFEDDLQMMNRAHNVEEAKKCLEIATQYFDNITIDLIYGMPNMSNEKWLQNIETALSFNIPHISSYALTVEPKTALHKLIQLGKIQNTDDEMSNFGKEGYFSKNNSAYWLGKKYLGIGPSAHSFNGISRSWNVANNSLYLKSMTENRLPSETEILSKNDRYNEYIMTGLRTIWGISLDKIQNDFGDEFVDYLLNQSQKHLQQNFLNLENGILSTTQQGKFFSDGIASDLFMLN
jgi:oxygen-independent coproporphyrinogen-3 oxidase